MKWNRVDSQNPCPVCFHTDWCTINSDGNYVCCARIPSSIRLGDAGYIHPNKSGVKIDKPISIKNDFMKVWNEANDEPDTEILERLWNIDPLTFRLFHIRYSEQKKCFLFPMFDGQVVNIVGIQERYLNGDKKATSGSKLGLFIADLSYWDGPNYDLIICEGFSDTITMIDSGFFAIGRPSCSTGTDHILEFILGKPINKIHIAADNDRVGIDGAIKLRAAIRKRFPLNVTIVIPPPGIKDVREWRRKNPDFYENFLDSNENEL